MAITFTPSTGAGAGAAASVFGDDAQGRIELLTGAGCVLGDVVGTLVFNQPYSSPPEAIVILPADENSTIQVANNFVPLSSIATIGFDIKNVGTALADGTAYIWYFKIFR